MNYEDFVKEIREEEEKITLRTHSLMRILYYFLIVVKKHISEQTQYALRLQEKKKNRSVLIWQRA